MDGSAMPGPGKKFVKGQVANPRGGASHNPVVKKIRKLTQSEIEELGALVLFSNLEKLEDIAKDKENSSGLKVWMARIVLNGVNRGDVAIFNAFCDRLGLKQIEKFQHAHTAELPPQVIVSLPSNGREVDEQRQEVIVVEQAKRDKET